MKALQTTVAVRFWLLLIMLGASGYALGSIAARIEVALGL
jgi:hypothetical protein